MNSEKLFCPNCGEEINLETYVAKIKNNIYYYCAMCDTDISIISDEDKNEIKIGW
ncbi:MAG: cysteine-rich KTR protein [Bacteriophage sp.]|nr:MAG: cysteine-rich KTR protein [Bacteriophage sp.]